MKAGVYAIAVRLSPKFLYITRIHWHPAIQIPFLLHVITDFRHALSHFLYFEPTLSMPENKHLVTFFPDNCCWFRWRLFAFSHSPVSHIWQEDSFNRHFFIEYCTKKRRKMFYLIYYQLITVLHDYFLPLSLAKSGGSSYLAPYQRTFKVFILRGCFCTKKRSAFLF